MNANVGGIDKILRVIVGIVLIGLRHSASSAPGAGSALCRC